MEKGGFYYGMSINNSDYTEEYKMKKPRNYGVFNDIEYNLNLIYFFTAFTTAANASGWFIAKSANTLRFNCNSLLFSAPIN